MCRLFLSFLAMCLCLTTIGCTKDDKSAKKPAVKKIDPMLAVVPAETNYFANIDLSEMPEALKTQGKAALENNAELTKSIESLKESSMASERFGGVLFDAIIKNYLNGTMSKMGMSNTPRLVVYGLGMWPAITIQLKDAKAFEAWLTEQEKTAKISAKTETLGKRTYRTYPIQQEVFSALAINEKTATFGVVPVELKAQIMPYILGDKAPSKTLNDTDTLSKLVKEHAFSTQNYAYVNLVDFFKTLASRGDGLNKTFIVKEMSNFNLDLVCQDEIIGLLNKGPRIVAGLDKVTASETNARLVWEFEDNLATELMSIASSTADKGASGGLASFSFAFDSGKTIDLFKKKAAELSAAPFKCKDLQDFNQEIAKTNGQLMFVPPFARAFKGIQINISEISGSAAGLDVSANLVLTVESAPLVLDAVKGMLPLLAALPKMKPDGIPMPLNQFPMPAFAKAPHLALGANSLGLSIGTNEKTRLQALVGGSSLKPSSFVSVSYDFDKMIKALKAAESSNPDLAKTVAELTKMGLKGSSASDVKFTKKGLEFSTKQTLIIEKP